MRQLKIVQSITNRESRSFEKYLQDIGKIELITPEDEVRLALLVQQGDESAVVALVKANLRFVVSVAKKYQHLGCSLSDLVDEGNLGLIKAARQFDVSRGFKFISYAVWWIRQSILQFIVDHGRMIRLPSNRYSQHHQIQKVMQSLAQTLEREPSLDEIADAMQADAAEISTTLNSASWHVSLDAPFSTTDETSLIDTLANTDSQMTEEDLYHKGSLQIEMKRFMQVLTARQRDILCDYFGIGLKNTLTLDEIGVKFDLSKERVRQIKEAALRKLRSTRNSDVLRSYLSV